MDRRGFLGGVATGVAVGLATGGARGETSTDASRSDGAAAASERLGKDLEVLRSRLGLPALGGIAVSRDGIIAEAVTGFRRVGENVPVLPGAHWQLASVTKTFTATLAAMMVDRGKTSWDATLGSIYPE